MKVGRRDDVKGAVEWRRWLEMRVFGVGVLLVCKGVVLKVDEGEGDSLMQRVLKCGL